MELGHSHVKYITAVLLDNMQRLIGDLWRV